MVLLSNFNLGENVMFTRFLKYFSFSFLIWTYHTYNDASTFPKSLESVHELNKPLNIKHSRLLAKHELQRGIGNTSVRDKISDNTIDNRKKNVAQSVSKYSHLKGIESNNFEAYMKDYKRRYRKKNGLFKLDCYCEKKLFDKILYVKELSEKVHNDKKRFKKIFFKKYGIGLILFSLIPTFGFILPILFGVQNWGWGVLPSCNVEAHKNNPGDCDKWHKFQLEEHLKYMIPFNSIFSFTMITIILTFLIYIIIKFMKYEKLKAGKGKMSAKENVCFCKNIFLGK